MPVRAAGNQGTQATAATRAVTVDSLMRAGGLRYESTPHGRQDAYTSVIASKGKLYSVLVGFGRPARLTQLSKSSEKATLTTVLDNASRDGRLTRTTPLTAAQIKNCKRVDVSVPGRADQTRTLYIDKKTNEMYVHVGSMAWGRNAWSKLEPTDTGAGSAAGGRVGGRGSEVGGRGSSAVGGRGSAIGGRGSGRVIGGRGSATVRGYGGGGRPS